MLQSVGGPRCEPSERDAASCQYLLWNAAVITASHTNMSPHWREHIISNAELTLQMCSRDHPELLNVRVDLFLLISSHGLNEA